MVIVEDLKRAEQETGVLNITVDVPVSVNSMYVNTRGGGRRLSAKATNYVRDSRALINMAIEDQKWVKPERGVWLYVDMVFYFPDRIIRDSHNCLKLLMDVMQGIVYINDYNALPRIMSVEYDKANPRVEIKVHAQTEELRNLHINDMM